MIDVEQKYYDLRKDIKLSVLEQAHELALFINKSSERRQQFIMFYNQFLILSKFQESIKDKVLTLLTTKAASIVSYKKNNAYWFLFSEDTILNFIDSKIIDFPEILHIKKFKNFIFSSENLRIDEKFVGMNHSLDSLFLDKYDCKNSVSIEKILKGIFVEYSLTITVSDLNLLALIIKYDKLQELDLRFDIHMDIDFSFLKSFQQLKVLKITGNISSIPTVFYDLHSLEEIYIFGYSSSSFDMKFLEKENLKYISLFALNISEENIKHIVDNAPPELIIDIY